MSKEQYIAKLRQVYENGADSSNLKISWIHETFIFVKWLKHRDDAISQFGLNQLVGKQIKMATHNMVGTCGRWTRGVAGEEENSLKSA